MKLGFTSIYSWRPHVEQMHYLALLAKQEGHEACFLTCDGDLPACYTRQMRPNRARIAECTACRFGGIRSYVNENISSIGEMAANAPPAPIEADQWVVSSASTLGRFESDAEFASLDFAAYVSKLAPAADKAYRATRAWIEHEKLDGVFLFNGRIDVTRAVMEAAKDAKIPFVSVERTWFGDGIQLLPNEGCLGLKNIDRMVAEWRERPLSRHQALTAASHIAARFLRRNRQEWRAYNLGAQKTAWPVTGGKRRVLLLPGSRNEVWGDARWRSEWPETIHAFDALTDHFGLKPEDIVLRCHPNWGEKIGRTAGKMSEDYYSAWTQKRRIHCIPSTDKASTMDLIAEADAIVVAGGSAALEAGALGKQVIALAPSWYQEAGFQTTVYSRDYLANLQLNVDKADREVLGHEIQKRTLRFCYTISHRVAQFVSFVRAVSTTEYTYFQGADPARLIALIKTGLLQPDDANFAAGEREESEILNLMAAREWEKLLVPPEQKALMPFPVHRRHIHQGIDWIRSRMRRGDL